MGKKEQEPGNRIEAWFDKYMPTREGLAENKYLKPFAHRFLRSELWRFTRRSVPRGVALGLFSAFITPIFQIVLAAFLALPVRANMPIAVLTTFVTNPLTFPFWFYVANKVGEFVLQIESLTGEPLDGGGARESWITWMLQEVGLTAIGLATLAVVSSSLGYIIASWVWNWMVVRKRRRRSKKHAARREELG